MSLSDDSYHLRTPTYHFLCVSLHIDLLLATPKCSLSVSHTLDQGKNKTSFAREPSVSQGPEKQPPALSGLCFQTDLSDSTQPSAVVILGETRKCWVLMGNPTGYQLELRSPRWAERQGREASKLKQQNAHPPSSCGYLGLTFFLRFPTLKIYRGSHFRSAKKAPPNAVHSRDACAPAASPPRPQPGRRLPLAS